MKTRDERFWEKVDLNGPAIDFTDPLVRPGIVGSCWQWLRATSKGGYGVFWDGQKLVGAHVYAMRSMGIEAVEEYDHLCRNRKCVNPGHLEPTTRRVNIARGDGKASIAVATDHCKWGHRLDQANTYISSRGGRVCRKCQAEAQRMYKARARDSRLNPREREYLVKEGIK